MTEKIVVFTTCGSEEESKLLAERLIQERLAACVNVIAPVRSYYRWQGSTQSSAEWLLLIKTRQSLLPFVEALVKASHSYELPEVLALPVVGGSAEYLKWLNDETKDPEYDK